VLVVVKEEARIGAAAVEAVEAVMKSVVIKSVVVAKVVAANLLASAAYEIVRARPML